MGKYELRVRINNARSRIDELNSEIRRLYDAKDRFSSDMSKINSRKVLLSDFYDNKLNKAVALQGVKGRANSTFREKQVDRFSVGNKSSAEIDYDSILGCIQMSISSVDDKIDGCRSEIGQLESDISRWEQEIRDIEREEEEEENARRQQLDNMR